MGMWPDAFECDFGEGWRRQTYTWVVRLEKSDLDTLILEVSLGLSKVDRRMVWRSVPFSPSNQPQEPLCMTH